MSDQDRPQLTLITPPAFETDLFGEILARVMDDVPIACVRLAMATKDQDTIRRAADGLREISHARDVPLVIETHWKLVEPHGLDGVHLPDGPHQVRFLRKELGADPIIGAYCGSSRHDAMSAGEAGADYVAFGPVGQSALGDGSQADHDLFQWWSEIFEIPVIAEGALSAADITHITPVTDFFGIGEEIWTNDDPSAQLRALIAAMG